MPPFSDADIPNDAVDLLTNYCYVKFHNAPVRGFWLPPLTKTSLNARPLNGISRVGLSVVRKLSGNSYTSHLP
jgi:hypothetical protein